MARKRRPSARTVFANYLKRLADAASHGDATEESFYPALGHMLAGFARHADHPNIDLTVLPRPTEAGNPDFRFWDGQSHIVGYLEAKAYSERLLDNIEQTDQLSRYRHTFPNLILTNFLEFRLYRDGRQVAQARIGRPAILELGEAPPLENPDDLCDLLEQFFAFALPKVATAEELARELAKRTRFLRQVVAQELEAERGNPGPLTGFFEAFRDFLIGSLDHEEFADLYAQTVTYGLFAARTRAGGGFNRRKAFDNIPHTIGVLRDLFRFISLEDPPEQIAWCVDDIAEVLAVADARGILERYYRQRRGSDPIIHFYETFLAEYDPEERERRGVYYTPEPIVGYIVRSLHHILKRQFGKADGLASEGVTLLDPAAGTMTFVAHAARKAVEEFVATYGHGARKGFIRKHVLRHFYAFELMMAPYTVGHLKMGFFLEKLGYRLAEEERVPFYLTNTLEMEELADTHLPGLSALAEESHLAGKVKKEIPILVILGNPPYSGHSANASEKRVTIPKGAQYIVAWQPRPGGGALPIQSEAKRNLKHVLQPTDIGRLIRDYFFVDEQPLGEKNPKWLQDDYVKFLRFAQWKIEGAGRGVVGMITNHSYLDNPTFRGMRQSLMRTFDEIYVLDLHGSALKREKAPDGGPDENVFDIRQGVAIAFFIKRRENKDNTLASVHHAELWGTRQRKCDWLDAHDIEATKWQRLEPQSPFYFFVPHDPRLEAAYQAFLPVPEIFPLHSVGIVTARDRLTIAWSADEVWQKVLSFSTMEPKLARQTYRLGKDAKDWKLEWAQKDLLQDSGPHRQNVVPLLYRPFDIRFTYYTGKSSGFHCRPRPEVMRHMLAGQNLALMMPKRVEHVGPWRHAFATDAISDHVAVSLKTIDYHFPLYVYPPGDEDLFTRHNASERAGNLNPRLVAALVEAYHREPSPEEIFAYVYVVLYAPSYREKYGEFLRYDFPRIPLTADADLFARMAHLGQRLVDLHLLRSGELDPPIARFEGEGDNKVGRGQKAGVRYEPDGHRVHINPDQFFAPVPQEVWEYRIGGYQVCEKWLKDRRDRKLGVEEVKTYCRIVTALAKTIEIQGEIDGAYPGVESDTVDLAGG